MQTEKLHDDEEQADYEKSSWNEEVLQILPAAYNAPRN